MTVRSVQRVLVPLVLAAVVLSGCGSAASPTASPAPAEVIARGEELFQRTAGGRGCAACHGRDARGKVGAPSIVGRSANSIRGALQRVPQMSFISLTDNEVEAVAAYLQYLRSQADNP